jgi:hypothetical protein
MCDLCNRFCEVGTGYMKFVLQRFKSMEVLLKIVYAYDTTNFSSWTSV